MTTFTSAELRRRAQGARLVVAGAFLVLSGAFFKAQVLDSSEYRSTSESNRVRLVPLPAPRGELRDRNGLLIAENTPGYTIRLWADNVDSLRAVLARVDALTPLDTVDLDKVVARWRAAPYQPAQVFSSGEFRIVSILEEHRAQLPGLVIQAARDEFGNLASLRARHPDLYPGLELAEIPAADHFFKRRSHELQALVAATARRWRELPA